MGSTAGCRSSSSNGSSSGLATATGSDPTSAPPAAQSPASAKGWASPRTSSAPSAAGSVPSRPIRTSRALLGTLTRSASRVRRQERHFVAAREGKLGVARDLVAVERRHDVAVQRDAGGAGGSLERRGSYNHRLTPET